MLPGPDCQTQSASCGPSGEQRSSAEARTLYLLHEMNTPEKTECLGGPETEVQLLARQRCCLDPDENGSMFRVALLPRDEVVGSTGLWDHEWHGGPAYETGYGIPPQFQGHGLAVAATLAAADARLASPTPRDPCLSLSELNIRRPQRPCETSERAHPHARRNARPAISEWPTTRQSA